jgi:hypothetical protein
MSYASRDHRAMDVALAERLARDGGNSRGAARIVPGHGGALLPSSRRLQDLRSLNTMSEHKQERQERVLFTRLVECTSARGAPYLRGWCGASNLIGFRDGEDEQGRPAWNLFLVERRPRAGPAPDTHREWHERTSAAVARGGVDADFDTPF